MAKRKNTMDSFVDALGNTVEVGSHVIYPSGGQLSRAIVSGIYLTANPQGKGDAYRGSISVRRLGTVGSEGGPKHSVFNTPDGEWDYKFPDIRVLHYKYVPFDDVHAVGVSNAWTRVILSPVKFKDYGAFGLIEGEEHLYEARANTSW